MSSTIPQCLTVAGSDSGGGAGIQADLKTFQANGVFGMSVLTSVTAQNTQRVTRAFDLPEDLILAQLQAVFEDFAVASVKTGMLSSKGIVSTVSAFWRSLGPASPPLVVDPVMVSKSGYPLLQPDAVRRVRKELLPLATIVTPNRHEAELLCGVRLASREDIDAAGHKLLAMGPKAVLLKGGHLEGKGLDPSRATDFLFTEGTTREYSSPRIETRSTHGTGCTYSAAIAAWLARGLSVAEAVGRAKKYLDGALRHGLDIGHGHGPTHHFFFLADWTKARPAAAAPARASGKASTPRRRVSPMQKAAGKTQPMRSPGTTKVGPKKASSRKARGSRVSTTARGSARKPVATKRTVGKKARRSR